MIASSDIAGALRELGVERDDVVFAHAGLQGTQRVAGETPAHKLVTVLDGFARSVPDGVLAMPTFTYSFCDGKPFDIATSPSTVGALGERFRQMPGVRRTADPIFSSAILGEIPEAWERRLFAVGDTDCFGPESIFAFLRESNSQLVCFGVGFGYCTYVHHVEQRLGVPYRHFKTFRGRIRDRGRELATQARYFVRELEPEFGSCFEPLGGALIERGVARTVTLPKGPSIMAVRADEVEPEVERRLEREPDFLIRRGHPELIEPTPKPGPVR